MKDKVKLQARRDDKKNKIIESCCTAFATYGLENTTITHLCEAAKVNPKIMYDYFDSKDDIVVACAKRCIERISSKIYKYATSDGELLDDVKALINDYYADREMVRFYFQAMVSPFYKEFLKDELAVLLEKHHECKVLIAESLNKPYDVVDQIYNMAIGVIDYYCLTEDKHYIEVSYALLERLINEELSK